MLAQLTGKSIRRRDRDTMPVAVKTPREEFGQLFHKMGWNKGVEVGVNKGTYSTILCKTHPDIELYCIDPWGESPRLKRKYEMCQRKFANYNVKLMKMTSMEAVKEFEDNSLDFAYIDGNHTFDFVMTDIIFWSYKVRPCGIIACHDYFALQSAGVVKAVDTYCFCHNIRPYYVTREIYPTAFWIKPKVTNVHWG
jgi:hypothetical protein